jgi:hypothetical protein
MYPHGLPFSSLPVREGRRAGDSGGHSFGRELRGASPMSNDSSISSPFEFAVACRPPGISRSLYTVKIRLHRVRD